MVTILDKLAYKPKTFAQLCELSERFIKQEIYDGKLHAIKKGNRWRIPIDSAKAYLALRDEARDSGESFATTA